MTRAERNAMVKARAAERAARAARLSEHMTFAEVGKRLGVTRQRAYQLAKAHWKPEERRAR